MTEEERIAIWKANEELQEEMIAARDVRIAALEAQVAMLQPIADTVQRLEKWIDANARGNYTKVHAWGTDDNQYCACISISMSVYEAHTLIDAIEAALEGAKEA